MSQHPGLDSEEAELEAFEDGLSPKLKEAITEIATKSIIKCNFLTPHNNIFYCGVSTKETHLPGPSNYVSLSELGERCMKNPLECIAYRTAKGIK